MHALSPCKCPVESFYNFIQSTLGVLWNGTSLDKHYLNEGSHASLLSTISYCLQFILQMFSKLTPPWYIFINHISSQLVPYVSKFLIKKY